MQILTSLRKRLRVLVYITDEEMNLIEKIKQIEEIQKKRKENNKLLQYNTGEKKTFKTTCFSRV